MGMKNSNFSPKGPMNIQNFGNETFFMANNEENNDAWPINVGQFRQAIQ